MEDRKQARDKFKKADELFREMNYPEALVVLDDLDKEFPDTKNVIYPRAMCLGHVGRYDEALDLCRQLKVEFGDPRGEKLMSKISALRKAQIAKEQEKKDSKSSGQSAQSPNVFTLDSNPPPLEERLAGKNMEFSPMFSPHGAEPGSQRTQPGADSLGGGAAGVDLGDGAPLIDMAALDDMFATKPAASPAAAKPAPPSRKGLYIGIGIAAAVLVTLVALPILLGGGQRGESTTPTPQAGTPGSEAEPAAPQYDGPPIEWLSSVGEALGRSEESGQDVLLLFYSSSAPSPDLELMETSVWTDPTIRYLAKDWVCAKIDVDADPEAMDTWGVTKFPTTIVTDYAFEEQYYRQEGFLDSQEFYTAMVDNGLLPQDETVDLPRLPVIALVLLPILYIVATFLPVLFTLLILGQMPDDDLVSSLLGMVLVGLVAPILGMFVMRAVYHLGRVQMLLYYGLLAAHMFVLNWIMTLVSQLDIPFFVYVYAYALGS